MHLEEEQRSILLFFIQLVSLNSKIFGQRSHNWVLQSITVGYWSVGRSTDSEGSATGGRLFILVRKPCCREQ